MSSFTNEIKLQALKDNKRLLLEDFSFYLDIEDNKITIEAGFITDWASVPYIFRFIWCPLDLPALKAAILHDWLRSRWYKKEYADSLFLKAMRVAWVCPIKANIYYIAVYLFGFIKYKKKINRIGK